MITGGLEYVTRSKWRRYSRKATAFSGVPNCSRDYFKRMHLLIKHRWNIFKFKIVISVIWTSLDCYDLVRNRAVNNRHQDFTHFIKTFATQVIHKQVYISCNQSNHCLHVIQPVQNLKSTSGNEKFIFHRTWWTSQESCFCLASATFIWSFVPNFPSTAGQIETSIKHQTTKLDKTLELWAKCTGDL